MQRNSGSKDEKPAVVGQGGDWEDEDLSLSGRAYKTLEELIITGELSPGAVYSEAALTGRLGIGRTPVREALQRLNFDGLVQIFPRRGIMVSEMNVQTQLKMLEVRRLLEGLVVRLAVIRSTEAERKHFRAVADELEEAARRGDGIAFMRVDREFNLLLTTAAQNEFLHKATASCTACLAGSGSSTMRRLPICPFALGSTLKSPGQSRMETRKRLRQLPTV